MNIELATLIHALRVTLQDEVRPELSTDYARGQLAAVNDILSKLETMAVWSPDAATQQAQVLIDGSAAFLVTLAKAGVTLSLPAPELASSAEGALRSAETKAVQLSNWLFDHGAVLPQPIRDELDAILRQALRQQLLIQRKLIPLTDFGAMTAAAKA